jgi:hypothetical protein
MRKGSAVIPRVSVSVIELQGRRRLSPGVVKVVAVGTKGGGLIVGGGLGRASKNWEVARIRGAGHFRRPLGYFAVRHFDRSANRIRIVPQGCRRPAPSKSGPSGGADLRELSAKPKSKRGIDNVAELENTTSAHAARATTCEECIEDSSGFCQGFVSISEGLATWLSANSKT